MRMSECVQHTFQAPISMRCNFITISSKVVCTSIKKVFSKTKRIIQDWACTTSYHLFPLHLLCQTSLWYGKGHASNKSYCRLYSVLPTVATTCRVQAGYWSCWGSMNLWAEIQADSLSIVWELWASGYSHSTPLVVTQDSCRGKRTRKVLASSLTSDHISLCISRACIFMKF